ncbi:hypothetical protein B0A48_04922 [Cryoendolithus antarcticus]|uniref:U2 small nuclear ribonucleoprotein A' n=1 Tax=Cryoendolithus antarcticus TaxID=1507870 RepID=A0A1V8TDR2_9PEZI|nr:hypothetical protein B0A48_04922 [Cryoendolithus antarcticus]
MRLTAELIHSSLTYLNPLKERELDLRGHKIPTIENLGAAKDVECIDLTDNEIQVLANFPLSPRLQTLLVARNRVRSIEGNVVKSLPSLGTLSLTGNDVRELGDLEVLKGWTQLVHISLVDNPVCGKEHYRYWVIYLAPSVRFLDFQRVKQAERTKAQEIFGTLAEPSTAARAILATKGRSAGFAAPTTNGAPSAKRVKLSDKEKLRMEALVKNAKSLAEIAKLEKDISEGRIPASVLDSEAMDET